VAAEAAAGASDDGDLAVEPEPFEYHPLFLRADKLAAATAPRKRARPGAAILAQAIRRRNLVCAR